MSCNIVSYKRTGNYLEEYTQNPGLVSMTIADFTYWPKHSSEECAQACSNRQDFTCRSFQYCEKSNECFIFKSRVVGLPRYSESVPKCSYYTSKIIVTVSTRVHAGTKIPDH